MIEVCKSALAAVLRLAAPALLTLTAVVACGEDAGAPAAFSGTGSSQANAGSAAVPSGGASSGGSSSSAGNGSIAGKMMGGMPSARAAGSSGGASTSGGMATAGTSEVGGAPPGTVRYTTNFDLTELPISEGGVWQHGDPNQSAVRTSDGLAYGTQNGLESEGGNYNDSSAFLTGFPANQRASAVIHRTATTISGNLEVELLLRWSEGVEQVGQFGKTTSYGYEINLGQGNFGTFIQIGRWKRLNLFDSMKSGSPVSTLGVHDGDVLKAQIVGNEITVWLNDTVIGTATDDTSWLPATGSPGIGFFRHDIPGPINPKDHCFTSFTAEALP